MSILLTGASGFIGKTLFRKLILKYGKESVMAFVSKPIEDGQFLLNNNYLFDENYFTESNFQYIDTIIHVGAFIPKTSSNANNIKMCNSNIINTEKLLSANLPNLKKFIFISTVDVYDSNVDTITENSPINPVSLYGSSKLYCEKMIEVWAKNNNKICQILRIGHVYGNGEEIYQKIIPLTINKILNNQTIELWGSGEDVRTFIHVNDVADSIIASLELEKYVLPINIVGDEKITIKELINKLITLSGKKCEIKQITSNISPRNLIFDNSKLKKYLIHSQKKIDNGLLEEINYMENLL